METKACIKCTEYKSVSLFEKRRNVCKKCRLEQTQNNRNKKRVYEIKIETKCCELCLETKSANEYNKFSLSKDGLNKYCKLCSKKTRHKKKDEVGIITSKQSICIKCNVPKPDYLFRTNKKSKSGHYATCNECWKPSEITKERMREYEKRYREKHPEKIKEKYRQQGQKLHRRIKDRMRARITSALSDVNYKKGDYTVNYLGCSINYLKKWLEYQFIDEMNWENYSDWQIDHVSPCDSFNLTDEIEQKKCFNWRNLRPCWTKENLTKGAKVIQELIDAQKIKAEEFEKINPLPTQPGNRVEGTE